MSTKLLQLVPVLIAAGCSSSGDLELEPTSQPHSSLREVLVYDRGIVCVTAPCPYYQVVDRVGNAVDVASIEIDPEATPPSDPAFRALIVRGHVEYGDWQPGDAGNVLHVTDILGPPGRYLTYADRTEEAGYRFIAEDHVKGAAWDVDLTPLGLDPVEARYVRTDLESARVIVRGWLTTQALWVLDIVDTPDVYTVADNGIRCFVAPCPSITVFGPDGTALFAVASLDLDVMQLHPKAEASATAAFMAGAPLVGWYLDGSWQPHDTGAVLYVTRAHEVLRPRAVAPTPAPDATTAR